MSWEVDDVIKVTTFHTYLAQECLNTLHYEITINGGEGDMSAWEAQFALQVMLEVISLQDDDTVYTSIKIENVSNGIDILQVPVSFEGLRTGTPMPSYVAGSFRKLVGDRRTRGGSMRLVGMAEEDVTGNTWISVPTLTDDVAEALGLSIDNDEEGAAQLAARPVVWGILKDSEPPEKVANPITSFLAIANITTQNTRKIGVGR